MNIICFEFLGVTLYFEGELVELVRWRLGWWRLIFHAPNFGNEKNFYVVHRPFIARRVTLNYHLSIILGNFPGVQYALHEISVPLLFSTLQACSLVFIACLIPRPTLVIISISSFSLSLLLTKDRIAPMWEVCPLVQKNSIVLRHLITHCLYTNAILEFSLAYL